MNTTRTSSRHGDRTSHEHAAAGSDPQLRSHSSSPRRAPCEDRRSPWRAGRPCDHGHARRHRHPCRETSGCGSEPPASHRRLWGQHGSTPWAKARAPPEPNGALPATVRLRPPSATCGPAPAAAFADGAKLVPLRVAPSPRRGGGKQRRQPARKEMPQRAVSGQPRRSPRRYWDEPDAGRVSATIEGKSAQAKIANPND